MHTRSTRCLSEPISAAAPRDAERSRTASSRRSAKRHTGFTLIELMVTVAIVGLLAAIALPAYDDYITNARMAKLLENYDNSARAIRQEYAQIRTSRAMGKPRTAPETAAEWIEVLNSRDAFAPGGGPAIVPGSGDSATGAIGITVTGDFETGSAQVTLTRPIFEDFTTPVSVVITASSVY